MNSLSQSNGRASTWLDNFKHDALSSLVVFLVALPLSMGIAIASGVPMESAAAVGIVTAIVGGLLVGGLAGCPLQVAGPAAGLAVIVAQLIERHGWTMLGPILLVAGAIQAAAGAMRLGQWFRAVSPALVQGMLSGIGILIFAAQFHVMVDDIPPGTGKAYGGLINLGTIPRAVWKGFAESPHQAAAAIGVLTILVIVGWSSLAPKKWRVIPGPLVGVTIASIAGAVLSLPLSNITLPDHLWDVIHLPTVAEWSRIPDVSILMAGLALAFVASAESLLSATAVDAMQQRAPRTKYDRELVAQGVGNMTCGVLGVLPITGVIVRSSANVLAGARTRASTMFHGLWLLAFAVAAPGLLRLIPISSLAAILVFTGYKLMNFKAVSALRAFGRGEVAVYAVTLLTVVAIDLLTGVVVGIGVALARLLYVLSHLKIAVEPDPAHGRSIIRLAGTASFIRLPQLAAALEKVPPDTELHVHFEGLDYIDHACLDLLIKWKEQHEAAGGRLVIDWGDLAAMFPAGALAGATPAGRPAIEPDTSPAETLPTTARRPITAGSGAGQN